MSLNVMKVENWDDAARFGVTLDGYTPLTLGATIIGWTPLDFPTTNNRGTRISKVVMGSKAYEFDPDLVWDAVKRIMSNGPPELGIAEFITDIDYDSDIILNLPAGALDLDTAALSLDSNDQNALTLHAALSNYFRLRKAHVQSVLHKQTPSQAAQTLLSLMNHHYSWDSLDELAWRGEALDNLTETSRMMYMNQEAEQNSSSKSPFPVREEVYSFINFFSNLIAIGRIKNPIKPAWKWDSEFKAENVFFLKVESEDEQLLGEMLFDDYFLNAFLEEINHQSSPHTKKVFLFAQADDSLADWIVGTTIPVREMHGTLVDKGIF